MRHGSLSRVNPTRHLRDEREELFARSAGALWLSVYHYAKLTRSTEEIPAAATV
jgi:hypothetical protein